MYENNHEKSEQYYYQAYNFQKNYSDKMRFNRKFIKLKEKFQR